MSDLSRRTLLSGLAKTGVGLSFASVHRANATPSSPTSATTLYGPNVDLVIDEQWIMVDGKRCRATTINGQLPAPTLRFVEGQTVEIRVTNRLSHTTSLHWHGILLPYQMDGVPNISFAGIAAGQTFVYRFTLKQHGTYWYHAHSGFQEQTGLYGALIIDPVEGQSAVPEHTLVLSDFSALDPEYLWKKLMMHSDFDNHQQPTLARFVRDAKQDGLAATLASRGMWQQMRMSPTDFSDLSRASLHYWINGIGNSQDHAWFGKITPHQPMLLRLINASAQTIYDVRIPNLKLTVVTADGQAVEPVSVDELRIAVAETYDVMIHPTDDAYTFFAQSIDRSGAVYARLASHKQLKATVPPIDPPTWLSMQDMMGKMSHADHQSHDMSAMASMVKHASTEFGPSVDMRVDMPNTRLDDAGVNLRDHQARYGRRVLTYADLHTIGGSEDLREPSREIEIHLTGNMSRYMWGMDGLTYHQAPPVHIGIGERVRVKLVNDTMMTHPMHLHGMWSELRTPDGAFQVRKHTIMVQPAQQICFDVTGIAGRWAWHCHLLYHMQAGMMREVVVA